LAAAIQGRTPAEQTQFLTQALADEISPAASASTCNGFPSASPLKTLLEPRRLGSALVPENSRGYPLAASARNQLDYQLDGYVSNTHKEKS